MFKRKFTKKIFYWFGIILSGVILGIYLQIAFAWDTPTAAPPNNNADEPISAGANVQLKTGALGVGGLFETDTDTYFATTTGKIGIGTITPQEKLTLNGGNFLQIAGKLKEIGVKQDNIYLNGAKSVYITGKYAYVASVISDSLTIIDISDPNNPTETGVIVNGSGATALNGAISVYVSGKYAYVASSVSDSLSIIDISNNHTTIVEMSRVACRAELVSVVYW